jgi:hypothetical protein
MVSVILALALSFTAISKAQEVSRDGRISISELSAGDFEETVIHRFMIASNFNVNGKNYSQWGETEFYYAKPEDLEIKSGKLKKDDILKAVPSISTEDKKTLGLLLPPFAYFAKKF